MTSYLPTPAVPEDTPVLDIRILLPELLHHFGDSSDSLRWSSSRVEEFAELLSLVFRVGRVPGDVCRLAIEEVWHEDLEFSRLFGWCMVFAREDVGALERLWEEAENVIYDKDARGRRRSSCV